MSERKKYVIIKEQLNNVINEISSHPELCAKNPAKDFTRCRKLPVDKLLHCILGMGGNSLNKELFDFGQIHDIDVTSSAFVQQRSKLKEDVFPTILHHFNDVCNDEKTFRGYNLYAVDGSDLNIAKNPDSDTYIINKSAENGYNQFHINALYDLNNKTYKDCYIQPRPKINERFAALEMIKRNHLSKKDIVIADRGYPSFNLMESLNRMEVPFVFRSKNQGMNFLKELPMEELDKTVTAEIRTTQTNKDKEAFAAGKATYIPGPSTKGKSKKDVQWDFESPCKVTLRVVRFQLNTGNYETILTNLNRFEFSLEDIKELYRLRWGIETSFRELKYAIGLVNLHAKKEEFVIQEIYAKLIMYNFCERITNSVVINQKQTDGRKHCYQVNFTMAIHLCIRFFRHLKKLPFDLEHTIQKYILPVRPGRADKRKLYPKSFVTFLYRVA